MTEILRITTDQLAYFQIYLKYLNDVFFVNYTSFMFEFLSKYQCGFRKGYGTQHCLLAMLEKWKSTVNIEKSFGALLADLSEAVDCLSHELLLAKLQIYGFSIVALRLIHSYLKNRNQVTKVNFSSSPWEEIIIWCTTRIHSRTFIV